MITGETTVAEGKGLELLLLGAKVLGIEDLRIEGDSEIWVLGLSGEQGIRDEKLVAQEPIIRSLLPKKVVGAPH